MISTYYQLIESRNENTSPDLHIDNLEIMNNKGIYFIEVENCGSVYRRKIAIL